MTSPTSHTSHGPTTAPPEPIGLDPADLAALGRAGTATITTQLFKRGLCNTHLAGLVPMTTARARMSGEAVTLRYIPAREDIDRIEVYDDYDHPQRLAIESTGPGQVLVFDCRGEGRAASAGNILLTRLQVRGAAGFVADGTLRDSEGIAGLDLPVYAAGASPLTNLVQHHAVDVGVPIGCAGVAVYPGDLIVGDHDGVVCVPRHLVPVIARASADQEHVEEFVLGRVRAGAALRGTYPPDTATMAAYRADDGARNGDGTGVRS